MLQTGIKDHNFYTNLSHTDYSLAVRR